MGRPRLATKQKIINGSAAQHPERINKHEPQPRLGAPRKPADLDEVSSAKWDEVCETLADMGMLTEADGSLLVQFCDAWSGYIQARGLVRETGLALQQVTEKGTALIRNPYSVELHKYADRIKSLLAEMGLTPSSRSRVVATPKQEDDPFAEWMKRGGLN